MPTPWTKSDPAWQALNKYQRAAAMSLMEADRMDPQSARNALGAMINRSAREGVDLGEHTSKSIYQPTIEPAQQARLSKILRTGDYHNLTAWAERRSNGQEPDPVSGATHFLAPEKTMLALEAKNPAKYKNWGPRGANWTGYDPDKGEYKGVVMRDGSHAFLAPEGGHSVAYKMPGGDALPQSTPPVLQADAGRESFPATALAAAAPESLPWSAPEQKPDVQTASAGGFSWKPSLKSAASSIGAFASAMGGNDKNNAEVAAQMERAAGNANAQMLSDDEKRQMAALELVRSRRSKRSAFA